MTTEKKFIIEDNVLMQEWNWDKNNKLDLNPNTLTFYSKKKVWWRCKNGHSWNSSIVTRTGKHKTGCPYCANRRILIGFNDLSTTHPSLIKEWSFKKNKNILPTQITYGSTKKVWWKCCKCNYEWLSSPNNRTNYRNKGTGCPCCSNKIVVKGVNDLETLYPIIAKRWHPTLNKLKSSEVLPGSNNKAWWICEKDNRHYFETIIYLVVNGESVCPVCANQKVIAGVNDFATTSPELLSEWDYEKNVLKPTEISSGSHRKVWWKCKNGHSWSSSIVTRTGKQKLGCPICKKELFISFPEKTVSYYLSKCLTVEENKKFQWLGNSELDIYLPDFNLGIEYDGQVWHKNFLKDLKKDILCENNGVQLIRVREELCPKYESNSIKIITKKQDLKMLKDSILYIIDFINKKYKKSIKINIDIETDYYNILTKMEFSKKENSVANSTLIKEWNWEKNQGVNPETIQLGTHKKFWWICSLGHEWRAAVYPRTGKDSCGCPYCAGQKVISGWNDLETLYPDIVKEWDYTKNDVQPNTIRPGTNKKYWWICKYCNNEWQISPSDRVRNRGCPKCARERTIASHFKKVICIETNIIFNNVKDASLSTGINQGNISNCCRGVSKTAGGYHWKYLDEEKD